MPRLKTKQHKHQVDWKVYSRDNLGASASIAVAGPLLLEKTFKEKKYAGDWVLAHGNPVKVYIVEQWVDNRRRDTISVTHICTICDWLTNQPTNVPFLKNGLFHMVRERDGTGQIMHIDQNWCRITTLN